jgi:hypothetical protein
LNDKIASPEPETPSDLLQNYRKLREEGNDDLLEDWVEFLLREVVSLRSDSSLNSKLIANTDILNKEIKEF